MNQTIANNKTVNDKPSKVTTKYGSLLILVASFLVLILVLALTTYFATQRFEKVAETQKAVTQQSVVVQELTKNLLDINLYGTTHLVASNNVPTSVFQQSKPTTPPQAQALADTIATTNIEVEKTLIASQVLLEELPQSALYRIEDIEKQRDLFDKILLSLKQGGEITLLDGTQVELTPTEDIDLLNYLSNIERIWVPYEGLLASFSNDIKAGVLDKNISDYLVEYTRLYNQPLQAELNSIANKLDATTAYNANLLRIVQVIGILISIIIFILIVFGVLKRLAQNDAELEFARQQTDDIMRTVNEGLFLLDKDLIISEQYSDRLESILHQKHIAGRNLYDLLRNMISQKDMETTKLFVEQLYNTWVVEDLIQDLNPLKQVLVSYVDDRGMSDTKFLEFNFLRVLDEQQKEIEKVFVSVVDVTKEVKLQMQVQKDKEQHERQIEMISYLLTVNKAQLLSFITETKQRIARMNDVLRLEDTSNLHEKVNRLYRETHSLKGDASAIKLATIVSIAEKQERQLKQLSEQSNLKGNDFLSFTISLNELMDMTNFIEDLSTQLNINSHTANSLHIVENSKPIQDIGLSEDIAPTTIVKQNDSNYWHDYFTHYGQDIAKRQHKKIHIKVIGFEDLPMDASYARVYKDIAMQFLKNAIVHGVESPHERLEQGKDEFGSVVLSLEKTDNNHQKLSIYDDGRGIDWNKISQKAVELGQITQEQVGQLQARDLVRLLLSTGLSTAEKQDEDAGRGVGMDIVRQLAVEGKGKLGINSQLNQFTQMTVTFPIERF